ncbi:MAG: VanZ family protein [Planctomycetes bacterium]|nr:VanZ family protein [Planctomycetota bacterium]
MRVTGQDGVPGDRTGDRRAAASGLVKPPILRRATIQGTCLACLGLIIYGTLGPLRSGQAPWLAAADGWRWVPLHLPTDLNDVATNFAVYVPIGIALRLLVRRRGGAGWRDLLLGLTLAIGLSYITEVLQQFMPGRSSNLTDVYVNASAALTGCLLAPPVQGSLRRVHTAAFMMWHTSPWSLLAWAATVVTAGLMLVPLDFSRPSAELVLTRPLDLWDVKRLGMFALVGFCLAVARAQFTTERGRALREALGRVFLLALLFELAQVFIVSHACGLLDIGIAAAGGAAGVAGALWFIRLGLIETAVERAERRRQNPEAQATLRWYHAFSAAWRLPASIVLLATLACAVLVTIQYGSPAAAPAGAGVQWVPFQGHFLQPFHVVVVDALGSCALYGFLTVLCMFLTCGHGRAAALLLVLGLVGILEGYEMMTDGRGADITPFLLAGGTWYLAVRVSNAIHVNPSTASSSC